MLSHGKLIALAQFFTDKIEDYWHILYPLNPSDKRAADPYLYFYDTSRKAIDYRGPFSPEGWYLFQGYDGKYHLHALELAQYALACWQAWRTTSEDVWVARAMRHCDWLVAHQESDGAWRIAHKNPRYAQLPDPWPSSLAQAFGISALVRAYRYTDDECYLASAKKAAAFLEQGVDQGGVKRAFEQSRKHFVVYEEYPLPTLNGVLNGHISALLALYEVKSYDAHLARIWDQRAREFPTLLGLYDSGFWLYYALDGNLASGFYMRYTITQLHALQTLGVPLQEPIKRFARYRDSRLCQIRALRGKLKGAG